jgi:nickel/cobalt exporter
MRNCLLWICLAFLLCSYAPASAHPLGNFTINHLAKIRSSRDALQIKYVLDIAEIPTFQIMHGQAGGEWTQAVMRQWARDESTIVSDGFHLSIDGYPATLRGRSQNAELRPGAGGLPILRWVGLFDVSLSLGIPHRISVDDRVYADRRIGWKDVIVGSQTEPTNELRAYPSALIGSPRRISVATFFRTAAGALSDVRESADETPLIASSQSWVRPTVLSEMFSRIDQSPLFVLLTILTAFALGALHAAEPGHGKALLAFTLVGARATAKQALVLAGSLTLAHTGAVFLLGIALFFAAGFASESIYPLITLVSGVAVASIGARAAGNFVDDRSGHPHDHAPRALRSLNFGSAVWAAMSGGVAPCPAAIVVLLTALRLHHIGYGMLLIVVFSLGLASVLCGIGLAIVRGAAWLSRHSAYEHIAPYAPAITAGVISIVGAWMVAQGFAQEGVAAPPILIAVLTLAAIAGYALSRRGHTHAGLREGTGTL